MKVHAEQVELRQCMNQTQIIINCDIRQAQMFLAQFDAGKEYDLEPKQCRKKRSLDANAYLWVLLDKLAAKLQADPIEIYRNEIKHLAGVSEYVCVPNDAVTKLVEGWQHNGLGWPVEIVGAARVPNCTVVRLFYGSSTYDTNQMKNLLDAVIDECTQQGIETLPPQELERLNGYG